MEDRRLKSWLKPLVRMKNQEDIRFSHLTSPSTSIGQARGENVESESEKLPKIIREDEDGQIEYLLPNDHRHFPNIPLTPANPQTPIDHPNPNNHSRESEIFKRNGNEDLVLILSAFYGKLLVVMGIAFPMSEVISTYIPQSFYDGFYLYLYFGSIFFMACIYGNLLKLKAKRSVSSTFRWMNTMRQFLTPRPPPGVTINIEEISHNQREMLPITSVEKSGRENGVVGAYSSQRAHFGSFYLRVGAIAFGIGSMIYSGLEFGEYFEVKSHKKCSNFMIAFTPSVRMIFTFMQMYFIFLNSKMIWPKERYGVQFGLIHMIGTNLCVWLSVLVQETRHETKNFYNSDNDTMLDQGSHNATGEFLHHGRHIPHVISDCQRTYIIGSLLHTASPFLFPCTIEYSLICTAILYVMWKSKQTEDNNNCEETSFRAINVNRHSVHHYSVDCARASKGLFMGILIFVLTIISLILFFVLISRPGYETLATYEVNITELVLYIITTIAVLIGMYQVRELHFSSGPDMELDNILLIGAQTGLFIYSVFSIIGGYFTMEKNSVLIFLTSLASLIQLLFQTVFIIDASKRSVMNAEQARRKPGREIVTFLLVANLAMWAVNTLEKSRADTHPVQLQFYGVWAWTIITHISMPLAIFYRFHSTVCLCEIWKRAYKVKF